jgi:ElaB/YqjD/DUF883 family membrane-anchored ribosome-binding protein
MDDHRPQTTAKPANANGGGAAEPASDNPKVKAQRSGAVEKDPAAHPKQVAGERIDHAKRAVGDALASTAGELGEQAQDAARRIGDRTAATTKATGEYLSRSAGANPLTALLVAGAVGYALGYLVHRVDRTGRSGLAEAAGATAPSSRRRSTAPRR